MRNYNDWLTGEHFDDDTRRELAGIADDGKEIRERFYKSLEFGTGGLRGIIGAGTNRMNIYTVRRATQGLSNYILKSGSENAAKGVVIAFDSRRYSAEFARQSALVLAGNGIKAYIFPSLRPTPELSFAIRSLGCVSGIVITASHNPREYNGYKCYWEDGAQIPFPRDAEVTAEVESVKDYSMIRLADEDEAAAAGLYNVVGEDVDDAFLAEVAAASLNPDAIREAAPDFRIVYTPLYGAGSVPVQRALRGAGFTNVYAVPEQEFPDPDFPTVSYPNPEDPKAFRLALALADEKNADLVLATDPDCDRVGVVTRGEGGKYFLLSGNMTGALLTEYILSQKAARGGIDGDSVVISTIVSTKLTRAIAEFYGAQYMETLTGFKYIGEKIKEFERGGGKLKFVFGFEESYGYLPGTYARDKDAVAACLLVAEMAAYYKLRGMTLFGALTALYEKYGFYREAIESVTLPGIDGIDRMRAIMERLRANPPREAAGIAVVRVSDYKTSSAADLLTGVSAPTGLPVSDVLLYDLADGGWFCVRPSGTEPKIKIYCAVKGASAEDAETKLSALGKAASSIVGGE
ncbi:MAG: phospho-sugar mutase [Clostridiales bacterium]|jgi:phosphoglucomutase|nr:phospho-sugar mutase [Clostridiales bacterium]